MSSYEAKYNRRRKIKLVNLVGGKCIKCNEDDYDCLDFHHVDPSKKSFELSGNGLRKSYKALYKELQKCVLVCANCHRKLMRKKVLQKEEFKMKLDLFLRIYGER